MSLHIKNIYSYYKIFQVHMKNDIIVFMYT